MNTITTCFVSFMGSPYVRPWFAEGWGSNLDEQKLPKAHLDFFFFFFALHTIKAQKESPFFSWFLFLRMLVFLHAKWSQMQPRSYFFLITSISSYFYFIFSTTKFKKYSEQFAIDNKKIILLKYINGYKLK